ncbi:MAG: hypothetical protein LBP22_08985 [Deltaproteobacteria bacterium]|jgi:hypothetical protein|nr:hypothetical protein [Deltaproteobacteria bacterium]
MPEELVENQGPKEASDSDSASQKAPAVPRADNIQETGSPSPLSTDVTVDQNKAPSPELKTQTPDGPCNQADGVTLAEPADVQTPPIVSQAVQDLNNSRTEPQESETRTPDKPSEKSLFGSLIWHSILVLSLATVVIWGGMSFIGDEPYHWTALVLTLLTLLAAVPTVKFFSLPSRAGLSCLGLTLALAITSMYDPNAHIIPGVGFPAVFSLILFVTWLLVLWAVWRAYGTSKPGVAILLTAVLAYPLLGSGLSLYNCLSGFFSGSEYPDLTISSLNHSPAFVTGVLSAAPVIWPQAVMAILIPLIAAILVIHRQITRITTKKSPRHLAGFCLGLCFIILLIPGFLSFSPLSDNSSLAKGLRDITPDAEFNYTTRTQKAQPAAAAVGAAAETKTPAEPAQAALETQTPQAETAQAVAASVPLPPNTPPTDTDTQEAATSAAAPPDAQSTPAAAPTAENTQTQQAADGSEAAAATAPPETPAASDETGTAASVPVVQAAPDSTADQEESTAVVVASESQAAAPAATPVSDDTQIPEGFETLKAESDKQKATEQARIEFINRLTEQNEILEKENAELSQRIKVLEAQNELYKERLSFSDQLLHNLSQNR